MAKYVINKVKTWNGVKYAVQTPHTHYPVVYDAKGTMVTEKRTVRGRKKGEESRVVEVPKTEERESLVTVEYRQKTEGPNGKAVYRTMPALFENTSAGLAEAKRIRDMLIEQDRKEAAAQASAEQVAPAN